MKKELEFRELEFPTVDVQKELQQLRYDFFKGYVDPWDVSMFDYAKETRRIANPE